MAEDDRLPEAFRHALNRERYFDGRLQSNANVMSARAHQLFLERIKGLDRREQMLLGGRRKARRAGRFRAKSDGGAAMLTDEQHAARRAQGKTQRAARRRNRA